jgi:hypothetical protein
MGLAARTTGRTGAGSRPVLGLTISVAWLAAALTISGCAAKSGSADSSIGPITQVRTVGEIVRPIDAYVPTPAEVVQLFRIHDAATSACQAQHGYPGEVTETDLTAFVSGLARDRVVRSGLYGFFDPQNASHYGYGRPPDVPGTMMSGGPSVPPDVAAACESIARAAVDGLSLAPDETMLPDRGPATPVDDPRVVKADKAWSGCMAARGYRYSTPSEAISDPQWRRSGGAVPSPAEVSAATSDVACKIKTNLVGVALAVQASADLKYINKYALRLQQFRDQLSALFISSGHS